MNEEILIPLTSFATIFGIAYIYLTTRNKERMALIEKGASADLFTQKKSNHQANWTVRIGLLAIGIGIGVFVGSLFDGIGLLEEGVAYPAMIFLIGGAGLLASYFIERKMMEKNKKDA